MQTLSKREFLWSTKNKAMNKDNFLSMDFNLTLIIRNIKSMEEMQCKIKEQQGIFYFSNT